MQAWVGLLAGPQRIIVAAAREQQPVDMFERVDNDVLVGDGWNDDRGAACSHNLHVVPVAQCSVSICVIGSDANYRLMRGFRICCINAVQVRLEIKRIHTLNLLSVIFRFNRNLALDTLF